MKLGSNISSKLMMGATIAMVAIVLALFLLLFAQLFCSLFLRRRTTTTTTTTSTSQQPPQQPNSQSLCSFYSHGVVDPPPQQHLAYDLKHLMMMYISNPIYDQDARLVSTTISSNVDNSSETPAASSPPISPIKKLPPECPSARSICTTSPTVSNYGDISSSSSPSPSTSPSW